MFPWDKLVERLAGAWNARILTPALAFWGGGLLAHVVKHDIWHGWEKLQIALYDLRAYLEDLKTVEGLFMAASMLFLLVVSSGIITWLQLPLLRLAEGYWPCRPLAALRFKLVERLNRTFKKKKERWQALVMKANNKGGLDKLDVRELEEYTRLDDELAAYPDENRRLPTRLGNILRAAEEHPYVRYGLEAVTVWPRLWLLLPETARKELTHARRVLDERVALLTWGLLFFIWGIWAWWVVLVGGMVALVVYYWGMCPAARVYADLIRSAFDLYRFALYEALHWRLPSKDDEEKEGKKLTDYLFRGTSQTGNLADVDFT